MIMNKNSNYIAFISGDNEEEIYKQALTLFHDNQKVVLVPKEIISICQLDRYDSVSFNGVKIFWVPDKTKEKWILGMYTSGSTGKPKLFVFTKKQIAITLKWYNQIYKPTKTTLIMTSMPVTYNFSFIAGSMLADKYNAIFKYVKDTSMLETIQQKTKKYDKVILLANPVILDKLAEIKNTNLNIKNLFIDSGGAPLSTSEIMWFRKQNFELHEGYGLTETCSLTHFDDKLNYQSLGTCGSGFADVNTEIKIIDGKPRVVLHTPNLGTRLNDDFTTLEPNTGTYITGDVGRLKNSSLEIIGRSSDYCINNKWPKDTLEVIGKIIPTKCALVEHLSKRKVSIRFWSAITKDQEVQVIKAVKDFLDLTNDEVEVKSKFTEITHSLKIKRHNKETV